MSHADRISFKWSRKTHAAPCDLTLQKQVLLNTWQHQSSQHSSTRPPTALWPEGWQ